ncbi:MAG: KTSC domain-containing protein [Candidatus Delongbacteria bacterium]|nr:KTSC domain-containing protein [Candidatus Delongbacteria bacterium]MBN2835572.1 KTSC domain-containing protein [Candidatus Delongbacteria bacterium]
MITHVFDEDVVKEISYDYDDGTLQVVYQSGVVVEYKNVPEFEYINFLEADSLVGYNNCCLYKQYRSEVF